MSLRPTTRTFLASVASMLAVMAVVFGRIVYPFIARNSGGDRKSTAEALVALACFFGIPIIIGVVVAWIRMVGERKSREKRTSPLNFE